MKEICPLCNLPIPEGWELLSEVITWNGEKKLAHPKCAKGLTDKNWTPPHLRKP